MSGALKTYAFLNAKLRGRIGKMIPHKLLEQMIRAPNLLEAIQVLRDTSFAVVESNYAKTGDLKLGELELLKKEIALYLELERLVDGAVLHFIQALAARYEVDNLKNALRLWFDRNIRRRNIEEVVGYLYRGRIHFDLPLDRLIRAESMEEVIALLADTPYGPILKEQAERVTANRSLFPVEIALDHYFYRQLLGEMEQLKRRDSEIARRIIGVEIDMQNMGRIVRFKDTYDLPLETVLDYIIPGGYLIDREAAAAAYTAKDITSLLGGLVGKRYSGLQTMLSAQSSESHAKLVLIERILEQIMLYEVRHTLAGYPFTIGIVLAYFILKRSEIKKIMTILNAKYYQIPEERIKSAL